MQTDRVLLRRWVESDAEVLYKYASDPDVGPRAGWSPHKSVEESRRVIRDVFSTGTMWAVVWKETGEAIGCVGYLPPGCGNIPLDDDSCEVGCWIAKPYWNKGICTEAIRLVVDYCISVRHYTTLWGTHFLDNPALGRIMEKFGFVPTGEETLCPTLEIGADKVVRVMKYVKGTTDI